MMSKFFTCALLIFFTLNPMLAEAKGGHSSHGRGSSRSSYRSPAVRAAKPKQVTNAKTVTREDPAPTGPGMAQTVVGAMVGTAAGVVVGNAISDAMKDDEKSIPCSDPDELTDAEKETM